MNVGEGDASRSPRLARRESEDGDGSDEHPTLTRHRTLDDFRSNPEQTQCDEESREKKQEDDGGKDDAKCGAGDDHGSDNNNDDDDEQEEEEGHGLRQVTFVPGMRDSEHVVELQTPHRAVAQADTDTEDQEELAGSQYEESRFSKDTDPQPKRLHSQQFLGSDVPIEQSKDAHDDSSDGKSIDRDDSFNSPRTSAAAPLGRPGPKGFLSSQRRNSDEYSSPMSVDRQVSQDVSEEFFSLSGSPHGEDYVDDDDDDGDDGVSGGVHQGFGPYSSSGDNAGTNGRERRNAPRARDLWIPPTNAGAASSATAANNHRAVSGNRGAGAGADTSTGTGTDTGTDMGTGTPNRKPTMTDHGELEGSPSVLSWMKWQVEADCMAFGHINTHDRQCAFVEVSVGANPQRLLHWFLDKRQLQADAARDVQRRRLLRDNSGLFGSSEPISRTSSYVTGANHQTQKQAHPFLQRGTRKHGLMSTPSRPGTAGSQAKSEAHDEGVRDPPSKPLGFSRPRLVISVTGGAKDLILSHKMRTVLSQGLHQCSIVTSTWLLTGGCNCGVMKVVGELLGRLQPSDLRLTNEYSEALGEAGEAAGTDTPRTTSVPPTPSTTSEAPGVPGAFLKRTPALRRRFFGKAKGGSPNSADVAHGSTAGSGSSKHAHFAPSCDGAGSEGLVKENTKEALSSFLEESRYVRLIGIAHAQQVDFDADRTPARPRGREDTAASKQQGNARVHEVEFENYSSSSTNSTSSLDDNHSIFIIVNNPFVYGRRGQNKKFEMYTRAQPRIHARHHLYQTVYQAFAGPRRREERVPIATWRAFVCESARKGRHIHMIVGDSEQESRHLGVRAAIKLLNLADTEAEKKNIEVVVVLHLVAGTGGLLDTKRSEVQSAEQHRSATQSSVRSSHRRSRRNTALSGNTQHPGDHIRYLHSLLGRISTTEGPRRDKTTRDLQGSVQVHLGSVAGACAVSGERHARPWRHFGDKHSSHLEPDAWARTWKCCAEYVSNLMQPPRDRKYTASASGAAKLREALKGRVVAQHLCDCVLTQDCEIQHHPLAMFGTGQLQASDSVFFCTMDPFTFHRLHTLFTNIEVMRAAFSGLPSSLATDLFSGGKNQLPVLKTLVPLGSALLHQKTYGSMAARTTRRQGRQFEATRNPNPAVQSLSQEGNCMVTPSSHEALFFRTHDQLLTRGGELEYWTDFNRALKRDFDPADLEPHKWVPPRKEEGVTDYVAMMNLGQLKMRTAATKKSLQALRTPMTRQTGSVLQQTSGSDASESNLDSIFESFKAADRTFTVLLVVEGGPMTLRLTRGAIALNTPVVVVNGTGRFADILSYSWQFLHDQGAAAIGCNWNHLRNMIKKLCRSSKGRLQPVRTFVQMMEVVALRHQVVVFDAESPSLTLHGAILKAINNVIQHSAISLRSSPYALKLAQLELALVFSRRGLAERHFTQLVKHIQTAEQVYQETFQKDIYHALSWALRRNVAFFAELICQQIGKDIIDFAKKQLLGTNMTDKYYDRFQRLYTTTFLPLSTIRYLTAVRRERSLDELITSLAKSSKSSIQPRKQKLSENEVYHHLLVWAALATRYELARLFWIRGGNSIQNALFVSQLLRSLADHTQIETSLRYHADRERMMDIADKFEQHAQEILDQCYKSDQRKTLALLWCGFSEFRTLPPLLKAGRFVPLVANRDRAKDKARRNAPKQVVLQTSNDARAPESGQLVNCVSLAMEAKNTEAKDTMFISHPAVDAVLEQAWAGEAPNDASNDFDVRTKFYIHSASFFTFLAIFSYIILSPLGKRFSALEIVLAAYMFDLMVVESLQIRRLGPPRWASEIWNLVDAAFCAVYLWALARRIASLVGDSPVQHRRESKILLGISCCLAWISCLRFTAFVRHLGPKLIIMQRMCKDVLVFVLLLSAVLLGYAFAMISVLDSDEVERKGSYFYLTYVVFVPIFQIFGETFLDWYSYESGCVGDGPFNSCAPGRWLVPVYMVLFIFASNIMLVNLLIAMFGKRYEEVERDAMAFWRRQNYDLFWEYKNRTWFPSPVSWVELGLWLCFPTFMQNVYDAFATRDERITPPSELERFQELETEIFHHQTQDSANDDEEGGDSSNPLVVQRRAVDLLDAHSLRLGRIEAALHDHFTHVRESSKGTKDDKKITKIHPGESQYSPRNMRCRNDVDNSHQLEVSDKLAQCAWEVGDSTDESTKQLARDYDRHVKHDANVRYLNPAGRTGKGSRGRFPRYGPNVEERIVLTRWKRCQSTGNKLQRLGQHLLEVLLVRRDEDGKIKWCLPRRVAPLYLLSRSSSGAHSQDAPHLEENDVREQLFDILWQLRGQHLGPSKTLTQVIEAYRRVTEDEAWTLEFQKRMHDTHDKQRDPLRTAFQSVGSMASNSTEQSHDRHQRSPVLTTVPVQRNLSGSDGEAHAGLHTELHTDASATATESGIQATAYATIVTTTNNDNGHREAATSPPAHGHGTQRARDVTLAALSAGASAASTASMDRMHSDVPEAVREAPMYLADGDHNNVPLVFEGQRMPGKPDSSPSATPMHSPAYEQHMMFGETQNKQPCVYMDEPENTDQAWVEARVYFFHAEHFVDTMIDDHIVASLRRQDPTLLPECRWIVAHDLVQYESPDTKELVRLVVKGQSTPTLWELSDLEKPLD